MTRQGYLTRQEECKFYIKGSFVITDKKTIVDNLKENQKSLAKDLESQKELYKKYQSSVNDKTKQYNELAQTMKSN